MIEKPKERIEFTPPRVGDHFHEHLDRCEQCREQPFNLCNVGHALLIAEIGSIQL